MLCAMFDMVLADAFASTHILALLLIALLVEAVVGGMPLFFRVVPHPVKIIGALIGDLDRRLNRETRSQVTRFTRGLMVALVLIFLAAFAGAYLYRFSNGIPYGWLIELFFIVTLISQRDLFNHVSAVGKALQFEGLAGGCKAVSHIVGRDPDSLDEHAVVRAGIESCAENFSDGVVAPVFWYLLFGLPGLFVYKTVNTMDSMIGYKTPRHHAFGMAAAKLDDLLNFIPARLSGLLLALAALFTPTASPVKALTVMIRDAKNHSSPNAGWPEGAVAGALGFALAGPRRYGGTMVEDEWIGDGRARLKPADISRTLYLYVVACLLQVMGIASLLTARLTYGWQWSQWLDDLVRFFQSLPGMFG